MKDEIEVNSLRFGIVVNFEICCGKDKAKEAEARLAELEAENDRD